MELFAQAAGETREAELRAASLNNACFVANQSGRTQRAGELCVAAVEAWRTVGESSGLARALNNLGLARLAAAQLAAAESAFAESVRLHRDSGDPLSALQTTLNLGNVYQAAGRFSAADELLRATGDELSAMASAGDDAANEQLATTRINRAVLLEQIGRYRDAADLLRGVAGDPRLEQRSRAFAEANLAVILRNLGDSEAALERLEEAERLFRQLGDLGGELNVLINRGRVLAQNRRAPAEAALVLDRAIALAESLGDRLQVVDALLQRARLARSAGDLESARRAAERARRLAREAQLTQALWQIDALEGRLALDDGRPDEAAEHLRSAATAIDRTQSDAARTALDARTVAEQRSVFEELVALLLSRASPSELRRADERHTVVDTGYAEAYLWTVRAKQRQLLERLGRVALHATAELGPEQLVRELQRRLEEDQVLVEIFALEQSSVAFTLTRDELFVRDLGDREELERIARRLHDRLRRGATAAAGNTVDTGDVTQLSRLLPDESWRGTPREILVAADGVLRYVPFELLRPAALQGDLVVERVAVRYLPSALSLLDPPDERLEPPRYRLVGVGEVDSPGREPLPASARELDAAARRLGRHRILRGGSATFAALREAVGGGASALHLATHTTFDDRAGAASSLQLAPADGNPGSGVVTPRQIASLELKVQLTVLSACSTASGLEIDGQGLETLVGSFLAAGSDAVVASLWDVGDRNTATFMQQFYHQLDRGLDAAEALRRAKLELLGDPRWSAPHLWSGFVLLGEAPVIEPVGWSGWRRVAEGSTLLVAAAAILALASALAWLRGVYRR